MTPAIQSQIRDELRIRKLALSYFGHQGIQDLAVLGATLGNNIREIGRYKVTCDGSLVQGQYSIYELVHFGILFATGRTKSRCTRRRRHLRENIQQQISTSEGTGDKKGETVTRIYPTMLANLFPAVVFKALRKKSRQLPRLSEENSDDENAEESSSSLPLRRFRRRSSSCSASGSGDYSTFALSSMFLRRDSSDSTASGHSITHNANDIHQDPFLVSAGSVVTLLIKNRLHRVKDLPMPRELCFMGAEVYAHKMAIARTVRAQQLKHRQQQDQKNAPQPSSSSSSSSSSQSSSPSQPQPQQNRLSLSMGQPRQSFLIPEQINEEEEEEDLDESVSEARSKRLMQQILSLENKVPRSVRKWAVVARTCFSHELVAEDRLVQEWVDKQRIQVVLACGGYPRQQRLSFVEAANQSGASGLVALAHQSSERESVAQSISSSTPTHTNTTPSTNTASATIASPSFLGSSLGRMSFAEGIRLGNNNHGHGEMVSRPTSGVHGTDNRMSASQQMLSMHLWLSVLVSPLSPQQMVYDRFME
ncbi:hypothetical protein BGZ82_001308 [Podila clonocystis]|nr:hypothetical protein BGZ82_001308 [Podila clonocystis]